MRIIETKAYKFDELSDEAKDEAVEKLYDINLDYEWYESTYEDAENIGLKIKGFDLDRMNCDGEFMVSSLECAGKIIAEHGETCETHKTAKFFLQEWDKLVEKYSDGINKNVVTYENESVFDTEADDLESDFLRSLCEDYRIMLQHEVDYLSSEEAIIETIQCNDYEFTEDGNLI
jgi:hypothetical protein